jgi:hypothetical protein
MAINDFARRLLGFDPLNAFGGEAMPMQLPGAALASQGATPNAATVAQPTLDQFYEEDLSRARMDRVGNLGMMLMAASGQLTPAQRATILAQAPAYMDGAERDAMTAAQARLYGMRGRAEQDEAARNEQRRRALMDPAFLQSHNIDPRLAEAIGADGVSSILQSEIASRTPEAQRKARLEEAQIQHYMRPPAPEAPTVVTLGDGRQAIIPRGSTTPIPLENPQSVSNVPPGVDPQKWRTEQTKIEADKQAKARDAEALLPKAIRARQAYEAGRGYIGPAQSSSIYRGIQGVFGAQGETTRSDIESKLAAYQNPLVIQSLPPGSASEKDIAEARRGKATIGDTSTVAGLSSIDADISSIITNMGYNVPPTHISELIRDIRSQNREGVRQFIEAHPGGDRIVSMIGGAL